MSCDLKGVHKGRLLVLRLLNLLEWLWCKREDYGNAFEFKIVICYLDIIGTYTTKIKLALGTVNNTLPNPCPLHI